MVTLSSLMKTSGSIPAGGARAHTISFELGVLRTILNLAVKWGYLKKNPARNFARLKVNDSKQPRFLTKEECQLLLEHSPDHLRPIFYTFLNTGMTKVGLENLEWADIDFRRRKITIQRKDFWSPKTQEREIPINQGSYDLLRRLKGRNAKGLKSKFVFPAKNGGKIRKGLGEGLIEAAQQAGIEGLTKLHSLRHTYASHPVMGGRSPNGVEADGARRYPEDHDIFSFGAGSSCGGSGEAGFRMIILAACSSADIPSVSLSVVHT